MVRSLTVTDFLNQAAHQGVLIDVRTPAEFAKGHLLGAINIPLFTNEERVVVGTIYVQVGRDQAIEKGLEFVGVRMAEMVREAKKEAKGRPIFLYCWRGGMRSNSVAWLFSTAGLTVSLLEGGYKAYRQSFELLLTQESWKFVLLSGSTGCGKTALLHQLASRGEQVLDLEGLANHKGSAFGGIGQEEQPTTEHFINKLHHRFRSLEAQKIVWCEAESIVIGSVFIPKRLHELMHSGLTIRIDLSIEQRLDRLMAEYGSFSATELINSFQKIAKRFGPDQTKLAIEHIQKGEIREAAAMGLTYYDKSYKKSLIDEHITSFTVENESIDQSAQQLKELVYKLLNENKE